MALACPVGRRDARCSPTRVSGGSRPSAACSARAPFMADPGACGPVPWLMQVNGYDRAGAARAPARDGRDDSRRLPADRAVRDPARASRHPCPAPVCGGVLAQCRRARRDPRRHARNLSVVGVLRLRCGGQRAVVHGAERRVREGAHRAREHRRQPHHVQRQLRDPVGDRSGGRRRAGGPSATIPRVVSVLRSPWCWRSTWRRSRGSSGAGAARGRAPSPSAAPDVHPAGRPASPCASSPR